MSKSILIIITLIVAILFFGGFLKSSQPKIEVEIDNNKSSYIDKIIPNKKNPNFVGQVIIGHEVREFINCDNKEIYWLLGNSPTIEQIKHEYNLKMANKKAPYQSVVMVLEGKISTKPIGGFGANYNKGFYATRIVKVTDKQECNKN